MAVGGTTSSVIRAGKLGLPIIFAIIGGDPANFIPLFEIYKQAYLDNGHDETKMKIGVHMHSFFGQDTEQVANDYFPIYAAQMNRIGKSRNWPPYSRQQFDYGRGKNGHLIIGDPESAIDKLIQYNKLFGLTRFSAHMDVGAPTHKEMMKSIELFGTKIAPNVKKSLN